MSIFLGIVFILSCLITIGFLLDLQDQMNIGCGGTTICLIILFLLNWGLWSLFSYQWSYTTPLAEYNIQVFEKNNKVYGIIPDHTGKSEDPINLIPFFDEKISEQDQFVVKWINRGRWFPTPERNIERVGP